MSSSAIDPPRPAFVSPYNHVSVRSRSFLQALADTTPSPKQENAAAIYVHPLVKKSSAKLSEKSLEMCTESLGSETGSDVIMEEALTVNSSSPVHRKESKVVSKTKREYNFPPLLTSISNSAGVEFHRENGRLVMNAVVFMESSGSSLFHAERINGRLTLHLKNLIHEEGAETEEPEFETHGETRETDGGGEGDAEDSIEDVENLEGNMGIEENISRVGRCNEESGGERREGHLWNMETCWVAI